MTNTNSSYDPIRSWDQSSSRSGFGYIGSQDFGTEVESFLGESRGIRGGFYQEPSQPYRSLLEEKLDFRYPVIVNREQGMDKFISNLERRGTPVRELETPYHAKAFIDTDREEGLVLTGNISRSAIRHGRVESREQTMVNPVERAMFAVSNFFNLGYEGTKYQINIGVSLDRRRTRELHSILDEIETQGSARSTNNFIIGGPGGNSSAIIANHIRSRVGQEISITAPYIDDPQIASALMEAISGNSRVRIITVNPNAVSEVTRGTFLSEPTIDRLIAAGAEVYAPSSRQNLLIHSKAIGFEDGSGIIGSHNFTGKADRRQIEISVFYQDQSIADQYAADFEMMLGITERLRLPEHKRSLENIYRARRENLISADMSSVLEDGVILPSNLGGSYFYARAMYNFSMREAGHHDFIISHEDASIATAAYKLSYLLKNEEPPIHIPGTYLRYDKELQTQGVGGWVNEYIGIPSGWGRIYKDELGFIPSVFSAFGSALDNAYLFFSGGEDTLGLNSIHQPLTTRAAFYEDRSFAQEGLFSTVLGFGSSYAITTASAVALYLSVGEPLSLLMSEAVKDNIEQSINSIIPRAGSGVSYSNTVTEQATRQFTLGAGLTMFDPNELRRALIFSSYDWDGSKVTRSANEFFSPENFNISYYHLNSIMRRRGESLLQSIAKPFLMEVINPYVLADESKFLNPLDDLIEEIGKPIGLRFDFGQGSLDTPEDLFKLREVARDFHKEMMKVTQLDIDRSEGILSNNSADPDNLRTATSNREAALKVRQRNVSLNNTIKYLLGEEGGVHPYASLNDDILVNDSSLRDYKRDNKSHLISLSNRLNQVSVSIINAGEERQMEVAKRLQNVLDEIPLNPLNWRIFSKDRLKEYSPMKDYKVLGDILSFEDFTTNMRNLVLGEGGITSFMARYEVGRSATTVQGKIAFGIVNRIQSLSNVLFSSPFDAVKYLNERRKFVSKLDRSRDVYKSMEYSLFTTHKVDDKGVRFHSPEIEWDNNTTGEAFRERLNTYLNDETFKNDIMMEARTNAAINGLNDVPEQEYERLLHRRARERAISYLDPYSRRVSNTSGTFLRAMSQIDKDMSELGDDAVALVSEINTRHREEAKGILSLTSEKTFNKRVAKLKPGLGNDPTSKITKSKIMTLAFMGIAGAVATESIFRTTSGVSLYTQFFTALASGGDDSNSSINFSNGPLAPISGTGPRLLYSLATTGATAYIAYEIAGALRKVVSIDDVLDEQTLTKTLRGHPELTLIHERSGKTAKAGENLIKELADIQSEEGTFRIAGKLSDTADEVNVRFVKQITDDANRLMLKKSISFLEGRSVATAAIAFTVMSTAVMAAKSTVAWTLNEVRDQNKGLAPVAFPVMGAGLGYGLSKAMGKNLGFGFGLLGFLTGGAVSTFLPSSIINKVMPFSLGRGKNEIDPNDFLISSELTSFISQVKERSKLGTATRAELMAGIYAQTYSDFLGITAGTQNRMTHVVAKQSPLPFIQFFYAATTENQLRDEDGNIISPGSTRFTTGIQTAPILGGSFSVGLPVQVTPGGGFFGITYSDKSNVLDLITGAQNLVIGLTGASLLTSGFKKAVSSVLSKFKVEGYEHNLNSLKGLTKIADVTNDLSRSLLVEVPANIVDSMIKADYGFAEKVVRPTKDLYSFTLSTYDKAEPFIRRNKNMLGKYMLGSLMGSFILGAAGGLASYDQESLQAYTTMGNVTGMVGTPLMQALYVNRESISKRMPDRWVNSLSRNNTPSARAIQINNLPKIKSPLFSIAVAGLAAYALTDSKFGVSEDMDSHTLTRLGTIGLYGVVVGGSYSYFGSTFLSTEGTFKRWQKLENKRLELSNNSESGFRKGISKVREAHISFMQRGLEHDTNSILKGIANNGGAIKRSASRNSTISKVHIDEIAETADSIELLVKEAGTEKNITRKVLMELGSTDEILTSISRANRQIVGRVNLKQASRRMLWRGSMPLVASTIAFSTFAGYLGNGSIDEGMRKIYGENGLLNWGKEQGGLLHGLSTVISSTVKLITRTDMVDEIPSQYRNFMVDYVDRSTGPGIRRSMNLVKARNNPMSSISDLFESTEKMFVMNSSNAFIQVIGPVGFTFRAGEYGKRVNRYVQIQAPGADISTASYSIAASYGFRAALDGSLDSGFNIQNAMRHINQSIKDGNPIDNNILRLASIQILSSTAKLEPLKKRRRYSQISNESLDFITVDPLLTASLNYRKQILENISHQPLASLGTRLMMDAATNHVLADVGLLNALFSRDASALRVIMDDPFGILNRNVVIQKATLFSADKARRNRITPTEINADSSSWMDDSKPIYSNEEGGINLPFVNFINNTLSSLMGPLTGVFKWGLLLGGGFVGLTAATYLVGSLTLTAETNQFLNKTDEFFTSNLYEPTVTKNAEYLPIQASYRKTIGGKLIRRGNRKIVEVTKGNNLFMINQAFIEEPKFVPNLNKALADFQKVMNDVHLKFEDGKSFGEVMQSKILDDFQDLNSEEIKRLAKANNLTPKEYLSNRISQSYREITETYVNKFLNNLADTRVVIGNRQVSILTLLASDGVSADDLISITEDLANNSLSPLEAMNRLGSDNRLVPHLMNNNYLNQQSKAVEKIVDDVLNDVLRNNWADDSSMLSKGRLYLLDNDAFKGSLNYINQRIAHALASEKTSPLFTIKNYFGGLAQPSTVDRFTREMTRLWAVLRSDRGFDLDEHSIPLVDEVRGSVTTARVVTIDNVELTRSEIRQASKQLASGASNYDISTGYSKVRVAFNKTVRLDKKAIDSIIDLSKYGESSLPSSKSMSKVKTLYGGLGAHVSGAAKILEIGSFAMDIFESVNVFGAYSRLGASYTSGTYTEAQRASLARETGGITTTTLVAGAFGALVMNAGAVASAVGTSVITGLAALGVGAAGLSAGVLGGIVLAGSAVLLGAIYLLGGKKLRKAINSGIGGAYSATADFMGSALLSIGNISSKIGSPRAASTVLNAIGGVLGGTVIGLGLLSMGLFAGAAGMTLGVGAGIGMGIGIIGGLLFPNHMARMSRSISSMMGSVPFLGQFFNQEGDWLETTGKDIEGSPFFTGTAQQAIEYEFKRHIDLATSDSGTAMSQIITSREIYGSVTGEESYITGKSQGLIGRITPGSLVDPTLQRELRARAIMYSHTIVSRYIWNSVVSTSSNRRAIREMERVYRDQRYNEIQQMEREAKLISGSRPRRDNRGELKVSQALLNNIVEINNMVVEDSTRSRKALVIKVNEDRVASSSMAVQVRDYSLDRSDTNDLKNRISFASDKGVQVRAEVDEERSYIKESISINRAMV